MSAEARTSALAEAMFREFVESQKVFLRALRVHAVDDREFSGWLGRMAELVSDDKYGVAVVNTAAIELLAESRPSPHPEPEPRDPAEQEPDE